MKIPEIRNKEQIFSFVDFWYYLKTAGLVRALHAYIGYKFLVIRMK